MVRTEFENLRSFGQLVTFEASRSLELIKSIDNTIYACSFAAELAGKLCVAGEELEKTIAEVDRPIDPDRKILGTLEEARDALGKAHSQHKALRDSAAADGRLCDEDGVVDAFDDLLDRLAAAHNQLNDLCWAVGEHEADFDEVLDGQYTTADEVIKSLRG